GERRHQHRDEGRVEQSVAQDRAGKDEPEEFRSGFSVGAEEARVNDLEDRPNEEDAEEGVEKNGKKHVMPARTHRGGIIHASYAVSTRDDGDPAFLAGIREYALAIASSITARTSTPITSIAQISRPSRAADISEAIDCSPVSTRSKPSVR